MEKKILKIHSFYVISILMGIIVILISVQWGNIDKLVEYITFALTLTSLILALLAIIYAVFSNSKFTENITTMTNISMDVKQASSSLRSVTEDLKGKIDEIPTSIKAVEKKTLETQELLKEISLKAIAPKKEDLIINGKEGEDTISKDELLGNLIDNSSFNGQLILYACSLSNEYEKSFSLEELFPEGIEYMNGYLVSLSSMGIVRFMEKDNIVSILHLSEKIINDLSNAIINNAKETDKKYDTKISDDSSWEKQVNDVTTYFEV